MFNHYTTPPIARHTISQLSAFVKFGSSFRYKKEMGIHQVLRHESWHLFCLSFNPYIA